MFTTLPSDKKSWHARALSILFLVLCWMTLLSSLPRHANAATQNVTWTSVVNAVPTGSSNNGLKKSGGCDGCDDAGAISVQQITSGDGAVEFVASDRNSNRTVGLNSSNGGTTSGEIDFAFKLWNNGVAEIRENDTYRSETSYVINDRFKISYESGKAKYYKNNVLLYTSGKAPVYPAFLDTSFWSYNPGSGNAASISNATLTSGGANQAPTVSITDPINGTVAPSAASILIQANASDNDGSVAKVEFFANGNKLGEAVSAPFNYNWTNPNDGNYTLTAKATDNLGATTVSGGVTLTVSPFVVWTSVLNAVATGANSNGLKKSGGCDGCDDSGAISKQQLKSGDGYLEFTISDTNSQRSIGWNNSNTGTTAPEIDFYFKLWNTGPYVDIFEGNSSFGRFTYALNDVLRIAYEGGKVNYYKNGVLLYTSAKAPVYPAFVDTSLWSYNPGNGVAASVGNVVMKGGVAAPPPNQPPSTSITQPTNGSSFVQGVAITINANASDVDGSVSKVEFFSDGVKLGEDVSSPYSYTWSNTSVGPHALTAKATDNAGATGASGMVSITVTGGGGGEPAVVTDKNVHNIPAPPALPGAGGTFTDPVFQRTIMRLTSGSNGSNCRIAYSYWPSFNVDSTKFHAYCDNSPDGKGIRLFNFDPVNFKLLSNEALFPQKAPDGRNVNWEDSIWSGSDPATLFIHTGYNLYSYNVNTKTYTLVKDLTTLLAAGNHAWQMSKSTNDDLFAFTERNANDANIGYVVYKRSNNQRLYRQTSFAYPLDEVQLDKSGRYLTIKLAAPKVANAIAVQVLDTQSGVVTGLTAGSPDYAPGHSDNGINSVVGWGDWINAILLRPLSAPHQLTTVLGFGNDWVSHNISMLANNERWALVSVYNSSGNGLYHEEILQVATDGSQQVRRLAHHHSIYGGDYFNQPNGNISFDGKFAAFTSNWGNSGRRDVFIIKVPVAP